MIGILIVTHGEIGNSVLNAARNIVGALEQVAAISIKPGEGAQDLRNRMIETINTQGRDQGTLILTDILGGTPSNVALTLIEEYKIGIVSGINLPMVVSLLSHRDEMELEKLAEILKEKGRQGVIDLKKEWQKFHGSCAD